MAVTITSELTASDRALFTTELAEQILSYLPFQDLINAERTCRSWREIIAWSPSVRQGLFLEPSKNALSIAYQSNSKLRKPWQYRSLNVRRYIETYTVAVLHPYLTLNLTKERVGLIAFTFNWQKALGLDPSRRWRDMFVTQPPCRNMRIDYKLSSRSLAVSMEGREHLKNTSGVRLGMLVDAVRDLLYQSRNKGDGFITSGVNGCGVKRVKSNDARFELLDCFIDGYIVETSTLLQGQSGKT